MQTGGVMCHQVLTSVPCGLSERAERLVRVAAALDDVTRGRLRCQRHALDLALVEQNSHDRLAAVTDTGADI